MSIFDRLKDIVGFLNTRPESRTPEQEQIGEELSEAEKTARDVSTHDETATTTNQEAAQLRGAPDSEVGKRLGREKPGDLAKTGANSPRHGGEKHILRQLQGDNEGGEDVCFSSVEHHRGPTCRYRGGRKEGARDPRALV